MSRDDGREIADRINDDIEGVISKFWPGWMRQGDKALLTPQKKPGQKKATSSFIVDLKSPHRGRWYRHSQSVGGFGLALLYYAKHDRIPTSKDDFKSAFQYAKEHLGIVEERQESPEEREERDRRRKADDERRATEAARAVEEKAKRAERRKQSAGEVWKETVPLAGTHGEAYLVARGLPPVSEWPWNPDETIRFHPSLDFEPDSDVGRFPAVVGRVQSAFGDGAAVWQIFLAKDKPQKADLTPSPKIGRGPAAGGAVRIGGFAPHIGIAEGMETALAAWVLEGFRRPVWATLSTSGMTAFEPPMDVERITIIPDGDKGQISKATGGVLEPPGIKAARALRDRMKPAGITCSISQMCVLGDALDLLQTRNKHEKTGVTPP